MQDVKWGWYTVSQQITDPLEAQQAEEEAMREEGRQRLRKREAERWGDTFAKFDADSNGFLDEEEMKAFAAAEYPGEEWDAAIWPEMCSKINAKPEQGLSEAQFLVFQRSLLHDLDDRMFSTYDRDRDAYLCERELAEWATATYPADGWDSALWPDMCSSYGVNPMLGFNNENFLELVARTRDAEAGGVSSEDEPEPEPEPDLVDLVDEVERLFRTFDVDKDARLNLKEMRCVSESLHPDEEWDDSLWPQMCERYGAEAEGFALEHFRAFREEMDKEAELADAIYVLPCRCGAFLSLSRSSSTDYCCKDCEEPVAPVVHAIAAGGELLATLGTFSAAHCLCGADVRFPSGRATYCPVCTEHVLMDTVAEEGIRNKLDKLHLAFEAGALTDDEYRRAKERQPALRGVVAMAQAAQAAAEPAPAPEPEPEPEPEAAA